MNKPLISVMLAVVAVAGLGVVGGCDPKTSLWQGLTNPTALVRSPDDPLTLAINPTATSADRNDELPPNATGPTREDLEYAPTDYVIGPEDIVDISILDLFAEGLETVLRRQVSQSGMIDLPMVPAIKAEGLTSTELTNQIIEAYSPEILVNPTVSVTLTVQRQNTFSIGGAVDRPGTYNKTRPDMRLQEAIYLAGGQTMTNIPYVIIIRGLPTRKVAAPGTTGTQDTLPELPPAREREPQPGPGMTPAPTEMQVVTPGGDIDPNELERLLNPTATQPATQPAGQPATRPSYWVESAGGATPATQPTRVVGPTTQPAATQPVDVLEWEKALGMDKVRVIAIELKPLMNGTDPRLNIIVRENDIINVPLLEQGEFYVSGEVNRPGVYSLTGRKVTVKMALAAAGNVTQIAWPENSILIRRIGPNQEQIVPLNIEDIMLGKQADYYLKPDDVIAVGTHILSVPYAVLRNAFRLTYGFGFIYDRNFAQPVDETGLTSNRFTRF